MSRDCLILGSGRSGTSLAAGMLARAGYFMGQELWPSNEGNPRGYFEDREVNSINDEILAPLTPAHSAHGLRKLLYGKGYPLRHLQRWLAVVSPRTRIPCPPGLAQRIEAAIARRPFCFKDPRFCYTLPLWRPYVGGAALICIFRHPAVTANSILTECKRAGYLKGVRMDFRRALAVWETMYRHVLEVHYPAGGDWLFVHYDQLLNGDTVARIESLLETKVDSAFGDPALKRSAGAGRIPRRIRRVYEQLCRLAGF